MGPSSSPNPKTCSIFIIIIEQQASQCIHGLSPGHMLSSGEAETQVSDWELAVVGNFGFSSAWYEYCVVIWYGHIYKLIPQIHKSQEYNIYYKLTTSIYD